MRRGMIFRMRKDNKSSAKTVVLFILLGMVLGQIIAYGLWRFKWPNRFPGDGTTPSYVGMLNETTSLWIWEGAGACIRREGQHSSDPIDFVSPPDFIRGEGDGTIIENASVGYYYGWPMHSLQMLERFENRTSYITSPDNPTKISRESIDVSPKPLWWYQGKFSSTTSTLNQIPIAIKPFGFIINSLVYASIIFVAWTARTKIVSIRRNRRGQCIICGYSIEGLTVCPECGVGDGHA